jgi:hypothetical protein
MYLSEKVGISQPARLPWRKPANSPDASPALLQSDIYAERQGGHFNPATWSTLTSLRLGWQQRPHCARHFLYPVFPGPQKRLTDCRARDPDHPRCGQLCLHYRQQNPPTSPLAAWGARQANNEHQFFSRRGEWTTAIGSWRKTKWSGLERSWRRTV